MHSAHLAIDGQIQGHILSDLQLLLSQLAKEDEKKSFFQKFKDGTLSEKEYLVITGYTMP